MRIVAIDTSGMTRAINGVFGGVMQGAGGQNRVNTELFEFFADIFNRDAAIVTNETVFLRRREVKQLGFGASLVGSVTIFAAIGGDGFAGGMRPGIVTGAVPFGARGGVG